MKTLCMCFICNQEIKGESSRNTEHIVLNDQWQNHPCIGYIIRKKSGYHKYSSDHGG